MPRTRIKICGVRDVETALAAAECGADAIGLVFVKSSPRFIEPASAWEVAAFLPPFVTSVGLFMNQKPDEIEGVREQCPVDFVQLHGQEAEPTVRALGSGVIKAVRFDAASIEADLMKWSRISEVEAVLVDGSAGGEGTAFDWPSLAKVAESCAHPIILAGGLTPDNVEEAIRVVRPWAVDVSSGVEREKGVKDLDLIASFCEAVRRADG